MTKDKLFLMALLSTIVLASAATADVKLKHKTKNSGFAGIGASEGEGITLLAADKMKSTTTTRFTGGVVGFFAGKGPRTQTTITRLDKELIWEIDEKEKEYKEVTFAQKRAQIEEAKAKMKGAEKPDEEKEPETKINLKWDVQKTGEKKTINGLAAEHVIVALTVESESLKTHAKQDVGYLTMDQWLTPGYENVRSEMEAFHLKMAKAIGLTDGFGGVLAALMAQYGDYLKQLREKAMEIEGFPVLSTVTVEVPGGGREDQEEVKEDEEEKPRVDLPGGLGSLFGKKKEKGKEDEERKEKIEEVKKEEVGKPGRSSVFSMTTEVTEVSQSSVSAAEFELPVGYDKKD